MRAKLSIIVGLAVAVVLGVWWAHGGEKNVLGSPKTLSSSSQAAAPSTIVPKKVSAKTVAHRRANAENAPTERLTPGAPSPYICEKCEPSPFVAKSEAEAAWMRRSGFPTPQMRRKLNALDMDELKAKADGGNVVAMAIYGERVAKNGDSGLGTAYLLGAVLHGSVYACYGLSKVDLLPGSFRDRYAAAAAIRLAMLLGDYKASNYLYSQFPDFGGKAFVEVDNSASLLLHRLRAREYRIFGSYNAITLRPMDDVQAPDADK